MNIIYAGFIRVIYLGRISDSEALKCVETIYS